MEENAIKSLTVEMLQKYTMQHPPIERVFIDSHKQCLVAKFNVEVHHHSRIFETPCRVDALIFWFITQGAGKLTRNLEEFSISDQQFVVLPPKSIVEVVASEDQPFAGYLMVCDPNFITEADINMRKIIGTMMNSNGKQGILQLNEQESSQVGSLFELAISLITNKTQTPFHEDVFRTLISLFIYQTCDLVASHNRLDSRTSTSSSRTEEYFRRFLRELSEHYLERRNVTFYADRLCISSRYLTTIVRRVSGHSVTDWMNRYMITEAKYLLKYSDMSIQEIAYKLNFPNQSFFGKYFKQRIGVSPSTYRQKQ